MGSYNILLFERQDYESAEVIFATTFEADPSNIDTQVELKELCSPDEIQMLPEMLEFRARVIYCGQIRQHQFRSDSPGESLIVSSQEPSLVIKKCSRALIDVYET